MLRRHVPGGSGMMRSASRNSMGRGLVPHPSVPQALPICLICLELLTPQVGGRLCFW
jgi:hypothetical protein